MTKTTIAWSPNTQNDDLFLAISLFFQPWKWFGDNQVKELEANLGEYVGQNVVAFDSGRSALFSLLNVLGIKEHDEILIQGFTCVALPNPILWIGAKPIYVDTDLSNFQIDIEDLKKKITSKSKAIIIQYTFGITPDIEKIRDICREKDILLIEDCCHNFGQKIKIDGKEKMAGTVGDGAIFSMGMEKVISATRGGFATVKKEKERKELVQIQRNLKKARIRDILRGILNPIVWKSRERLGYFGELIYKVFVKVKLHELGLTKLELSGKKAPWLPYSMPNTNAILGLKQLKKIEEFNGHRKIVANTYIQRFERINEKFDDSVDQEQNNKKDNKEYVESFGIPDKKIVSQYGAPIWLRFPVVVENANEFRKKAEKKGILLGNWYTEVIHCKGVDLCALGYKKDSCPNSEWLTDRIINLPTHQGINKNKIGQIMSLFES